MLYRREIARLEGLCTSQKEYIDELSSSSKHESNPHLLEQDSIRGQREWQDLQSQLITERKENIAKLDAKQLRLDEIENEKKDMV